MLQVLLQPINTQPRCKESPRHSPEILDGQRTLLSASHTVSRSEKSDLLSAHFAHHTVFTAEIKKVNETTFLVHIVTC